MNRERLRKTLALSIGLPAIALAGGMVAGEVRSQLLERERLGLIDDTLRAFRDGPILFGYSPDGNNFQEALALAQEYQIDIRSVNFFVDDLESDFEMMKANILASCEAGITPMISWGHARYLINPSSEMIESIRKTAKLWASMPCTILNRDHFEPNIRNTFSYGPDYVSPAEYVEGKKRIWNIVKEEGADNVQFVLALNSTVIADPFEAYYPGDQYVDILGLDIYNKTVPDRLDILSRFVFPQISAKAALLPDLQTLKRIGGDKPIMITEIGSAFDEAWFEDALEIADAFGVVAVKSFGWQKSGQGYGEYNWHLKQYPHILAALQRKFPG